MSDEPQLTLEAPADVGDSKDVTPESAVVVTPDPTELTARDQGWVSKEEWVESGRDAAEWRPAKEFVDRGELYKSIHTTKRELKQTQAALTALQAHHRLVFEKAHQQAMRDLKTERRQALRSDDIDRVEQIETEIEKLQDTHIKEAQQLQQVQVATQNNAQVEFESFVQRNPWYISDKKLKDEADAAGFIYLNNGGSKEGLLTHVERTMKEKFPDKFGVKRAAPNAVAPVSKQSASRKERADVDLDESQREVMNTFVRMGVMTKEQYMNDLKKIKERS
jgi:hypothetical protein